MAFCAVKCCKNYSQKKEQTKKVSFHLFPADPDIYERWTTIVRRSRKEFWWKPGKRSVICSDHFDESDFYLTKCNLKRLSKGSVPKKALYYSYYDDNTLTGETSTSVDTKCTAAIDTVVDEKPITVTDTAVDAKSIGETDTAVDENSIAATDTALLDDFSDVDALFDTRTEEYLKKKLKRKTILQIKHTKIIKNLRKRVFRLKKVNSNLRNIIKTLKHERFTANDMSKKMPKNVTLASHKEHRKISRDKKRCTENQNNEYFNRQNDTNSDNIFNIKSEQRVFTFKLCSVCHKRRYNSDVEKSETCATCRNKLIENELNISSSNMDAGSSSEVLLPKIKEEMNVEVLLIQDERLSNPVSENEDIQDNDKECKFVPESCKIASVLAQEDPESNIKIKLEEFIQFNETHINAHDDIKQESFEIEQECIN